MIRKHTQFFDSTLEFVDQENDQPFVKASILRNSLVNLVETISILGTLDHFPEPKETLDFGLDVLMSECLNGLGCRLPEEEVQKFLEASRNVSRLESVLRYPWERHSHGATRHRRMVLLLKFFEKNAKKPFFTIDFCFSPEGDSVTDCMGLI